MLKDKVKPTTIIIVLLLLYLFVPITTAIFTSMRISMLVFAVIGWVSLLLIAINKDAIIPYVTLRQLIYYSCWTLFSMIIYYLFRPESTRTFYFNLWILLTPFLLIISLIKPSKKNSTLMEVIMFLGVLINIFFVIRAVNVFADAVRSTETAKNLGYSNLLTGLVGYSQVYCLPLMIPFILAKITNTNGWQKVAPITMLVLVVLIAFLSNLATALILTLLGIALYYVFGLKGDKKYIGALILALIFLFAIVMFEDISNWLISLVGSDTTWGKKLSDILLTFQTDEATGDVLGRTELYNQSLQSFINSPILGAILNPDCKIGGHSTILDILAAGGLVGGTLYCLFILESYRSIKGTCFYKENSRSVNVMYIVFIVLICLKNTITSFAIYAMMFLFLPLYCKLYDSKNKKRRLINELY